MKAALMSYAILGENPYCTVRSAIFTPMRAVDSYPTDAICVSPPMLRTDLSVVDGVGSR
jgi:hypothetical protein